ncbi:hypothetical protein DFQ28_005796 [Apophysomyces sp. BC1034]|nr:hypothetical protein DFQ30_005112 [Apophysomyces sp. BC1015]KAG0177570.1 hypothetical protein DFQ29_004685 [Apophysomyces sp. BC1021]KAG0187832.1 hypothetical protein DFQ28_005796 [Apophysomyces sp. BC1034]
MHTSTIVIASKKLQSTSTTLLASRHSSHTKLRRLSNQKNINNSRITSSQPVIIPLQPNNDLPSDLITPPPSPKAQPMDVAATERILAAKRDGNLKTVMAEYLTLKKEGVLLTHHAYNLILEAFSGLRREGSPLTQMLKVYDEMLRTQIQPTGSTYTILIRTLCKRDVEVQKVAAMLRRQSARSGKHTKSNDIAILEAEENLARALAIFDCAVAENQVQEFDVDLYNQLLRVLSHYGNTVDSLHVYEQLCNHSSPTSATFAALINLFGRAGDLASALQYFEEYIKCKPSMGAHDASYVYNALVDSHLKCNQLSGALKIVEQDMADDGIKLTIIPYNSIIRHYCARGQMAEAKKLVGTLQAPLPSPDASTYGPILSAYCQANDFEAATEMYEALVKTDISKAYGNLANYALLCLNNPSNDKVLEVVEDMRMAGLEPDAALSERIVTHFAQANKIPQAISALHTVLEAMSSRAASKGSPHLVHAALQVALASKKLTQTLEVVRTVTHVATMSAPLAQALVECFEPGHSLSNSDYRLLFEAALIAREQISFSQFVLTVLKDMSGIHLDADLVGRVSSQLSETDAQIWQAVFPPLSEVAAHNVEDTDIESRETGEIMKAVMRNQHAEATKILDRILQRGMVPEPEPMRDAIALVGKQGHLDIALSMYRSSVDAYKSVLQAKDSQRAERAVFMATNSVLIGYAQQGDMVSAKKYYEEIKQMGRYPDGNGYASLLLGSAKCATDEATDALTIYDEAKRHDVKPTTFFYNVVISKLAKARKLEPALCLFEEMRHFKITPNSITYGAIISACVRAGSESNCRRLFGEMLSSASYQPRVGPFNNMIQFYVRQQPDRERALEYFAELRRRQIKPSPHTYKLLMEAYATIAPYDMPTAHRMLSDMERRDRLQPQATHYATLIYSYGTLQRDVRSADRVFQEMTKSGVEPDEVVYQAMLDTLISNNHLGRAEGLYKKMLKSLNKSSSPYIENLFIRGYGHKGLVKKAEAMFNVMSDDKVHARPHAVVREPSTYEAMIRAYLDNNMPAKAKAILDRMVKREFPEKVTAAVAELIAA